jgi:predicted dehydrogenase
MVIPEASDSLGGDMTRRRFMRLSTVAGAGALLSSMHSLRAQVAQAGKSPNDRLQVALIGLGAEGRVLLESLQVIEGIQLVAICDIWDYARTYVQRLLKHNNIEVRPYHNFEELLAGEKGLDAVVVATPDFWHAPITNACLKAGINVYCEKMMSNTVEGASSMVQTMKESGKLLQIGHQRRSNPRYRFALNRLLNEAKICGRLTAAQAQWNRAAAPDFGWPKVATIPDDVLHKYGYADMHQFRNWRWFKALGGGPLSDLGAHQIDIFNWWFGVHPRAVMAAGGVDYYPNHEWFDNAMVIYEYPLPTGIVRAFYQVQTTTSAGGGYWEYFMGDQGSIKMSENPRLCTIYREASAPSWDDLVSKNYIKAQEAAYTGPAAAAVTVDARETPPVATFDIPVSFSKKIHQPHLENFFDSIRGRAKLNCPADEAFASEYAIHKANEAVTARRMLDLDPKDFVA